MTKENNVSTEKENVQIEIQTSPDIDNDFIENKDISENIIIDTNEATTTDLTIRKHKKAVLITALSILAVILVVTCGIGIKKHSDSKKAVASVISSIENIGTVEYTEECKSRIEQAQTVYDLLSDKQKSKVSNYDTLSGAVDDYALLEYRSKLVSAANRMSTGEFYAEYVIGDVQTVWHNAIFKKYDKYNKGNYDFNSAVQAYYNEPSNAESIKNFKTKTKAELDDLIAELQNPPEVYKEAYTALINTYGTFSRIYELADVATGSYNTYTEQSNELFNTFASQYGVLKALLPEISGGSSSIKSTLRDILKSSN